MTTSHGTIAGAALELHRDALVWDNHACLPLGRNGERLLELDRYRRNGADVVSVNVGDAETPIGEIVCSIAKVRSFLERQATAYAPVTTAQSILEARSSGRMSVMMDIEGAFSIGSQISLTSLLYDLGVRWMGYVYNRQNVVGGGCHDVEDEGLTAVGRDLVREMDRVGMIKDCSHAGYRTALDILHMTDLPTIFSHSNPRALCDHPRNVPDELLDACAATGGVVCVSGVSIFLGEAVSTVRRLCDHVVHVAGRIGSAHVGVGLDFVADMGELEATLTANSGVWPPDAGYDKPIDFLAPEWLPAITKELLSRGFERSEVAGVLGGNLMRVASTVWR